MWGNSREKVDFRKTRFLALFDPKKARYFPYYLPASRTEKHDSYYSPHEFQTSKTESYYSPHEFTKNTHFLTPGGVSNPFRLASKRLKKAQKSPKRPKKAKKGPKRGKSPKRPKKGPKGAPRLISFLIMLRTQSSSGPSLTAHEVKQSFRLDYSDSVFISSLIALSDFGVEKLE